MSFFYAAFSPKSLKADLNLSNVAVFGLLIPACHLINVDSSTSAISHKRFIVSPSSLALVLISITSFLIGFFDMKAIIGKLSDFYKLFLRKLFLVPKPAI